MARKFIRRWIPSRDSVRTQRGMRWLGPLLERPWLWQLNRRSVAAGVGLGVFCGFLIPGLQVVIAAMLAMVIRANLPVAVVSTLISNPFTYAPIVVLAYRVGAMMLGETVDEVQAAAIEAEAFEAGIAEVTTFAERWAERFSTIGKPLILGLFTFATVGGVLSYLLTVLVWRIAVVVRMRHRQRRTRAGSPVLPEDPPA